MPGVSSGKISIAVELVNNFKQIADDLANGLQGSLKKTKLDIAFNDKEMAKQAEAEIELINKKLSQANFQPIDWSGVIPPLSQVLFNDNSLSDAVKLQIIQGFRAGFELMPQYLRDDFQESGLKNLKAMPENIIAQNLLGSVTVDETIESLGLSKANASKMKSHYKNLFSQPFVDQIQDLVQLLSFQEIKGEHSSAIPYLYGDSKKINERIGKIAETLQDPDKTLSPNYAEQLIKQAYGLGERIKYLAEQSRGTEKEEKVTGYYTNAIQVLEGMTDYLKKPVREGGLGYTPEEFDKIIGNIVEVVRKGSEAKDKAYNSINPNKFKPTDIRELLSRLIKNMPEGNTSAQVAQTLDNDLELPDINEAFQMMANSQKDKERQDREREKDNTSKYLQALLESTQEQRSEEKIKEQDRQRRQIAINKLFKELYQKRDSTGINAEFEEEMDASVLEQVTEQYKDNTKDLVSQKKEIDEQIEQVVNAKQVLEKENDALFKSITHSLMGAKTPKPAKEQFRKKQEAYDEATAALVSGQEKGLSEDELQKLQLGQQQAWVEYYKAYKNASAREVKFSKTDTKRIGQDFGKNSESQYQQYLLNLKEQWLNNTKLLEDLQKTLSEYRAKQQLINQETAQTQAEPPIEEPIPEESSLDSSSESNEKNGLDEKIARLQSRIEEKQRLIDEAKEKKDQLEEQQRELNGLLESLEGNEEVFDPNVLLNSENDAIADWANNIEKNGYELSIERVQEYNEELEDGISRLESEIEKHRVMQRAFNASIKALQAEQGKDASSQTGTGQQDGQPAQQQANANDALNESAGQATGAVNGLTEAQRANAQTGQQAGETAQNAATAMREETEAANADADAQDRLATSRQNARDAQAPSTPSNPTPAPTPETPPTHPETPVRTGDVKGMKEEKDNADELAFKFISAAEAKRQFVDANKEVEASAEASAKSMEEESKAALKAKFGFVPEELQNTIDTTKKIQESLTQVSTAISQMDKGSDFSGIVDQLTKIAEAMGLIVESGQQVGKAMSTIQAEGGLKIDLQNSSDIKSLIVQFKTLNNEIIALVTSLGNMQSAIGAVDENSGLPNLLSQIQNIASNLDTISNKDFGINFNVKSSDEGMSPFEKAATEGVQKRKVIKQLEQQYNILARSLNESLEIPSDFTQAEDFWAEMVSSFYNYAPDEKTFSQIFSENFKNATKGKSLVGRIDAYQTLIDSLKQMLSVNGIDAESLIAPYSSAVDEFTEKINNPPSSIGVNISEQIKEMLGGDNSAALNNISSQIGNIITELGNMNSALSSLSNNSNLTGLKEAFEQIPQKIENAIQKIIELKQQIDTAQFSAGFDEQFKGLTEQLEAAKEQTKATNEELVKTKKLLDEETQARKQLQSEVEKHKTQDANEQRKANAEEKKALEAEKKSLEQELAKERQRNENRTKAVEAQNQAYLNKELERKKAIELEQMKAAERAEQARQKAIADRAKAQQAAAKAAEKAQMNKEDTSLSADYGRYTKDVKEMFDATTVEQYNTALQHTLDTEARIRSAREQSVLAHGTSDQILQQAAGLSDTTLEGGFVEGFEKTKQAQLDALRAIETMRTTFVDKQQASMDVFSNQLQTINTQITPDVVSGWGDAQQAEYQKIVDGANLASIAIESLNRILGEMRSGQFDFTDQTSMETFLTLKDAIPSLVQETQQSEKTFTTSIATGVKEATTQLDNAQKKLESIKDNSKGFLVIDDNLSVTLTEIETHLEKIKSLKEVLNNSPLSILNKDFSTNLSNYLNQLNGTENQAGIIDEAQGYFNRSKSDFGKIPSYFSNYATAINNLFSELNKGTNVSFEQLQEKLKIVDYYAQRIKETTGLDRNQILSVDPLRDTNATQPMIDAQEAARGKISSAFEKNLTDIQNKINDTKNTLKSLFDGFDEVGLKNIGEIYTGSGTDFNNFVASAEKASQALSKLEEFRGRAKSNPLFFQDEKNLEEYHTLLEQLQKDIETVSKGASNFKIVDPSDIQKAKADMAKFLRNPSLTGEERGQLQDFYSQMQEGINKVTFDNIINGFDNVKNKAIEAGHTGDTFFSMLTQRFKSLGAYLLSFVSFYRVIGVFKDGINIIRELDDALTEMQKVSDESLSSLREYQKGTFDTADKIGTTAAQLQQSTADWMRLGEDLQTASQSAQTANVLFNVSEFDNINDATTALVAMSAAYADAEKGIEKMDIVDRLNLIGNNYAIATDELATALQDGAATLQTAGNDLDQAIALTTAGNLITQDASKTGK